MSTPKQVGSGLHHHATPLFATHVVVDGSWKEKDNMSVLSTKSGGKTFNHFGWNPGADVSCDLMIKAGATPVRLKKLDILTETAPGTRVFTVMEVDDMGFDGSPTKQTVQLKYEDDFTPVLVEEEA